MTTIVVTAATFVIVPEGCELRISNLEFQPLRTMARAGIKPIPGRLTFFPNRTEALADLLS
ncbi:hypothetical protein A9Y87_10710 [Salmonella enterica subsp. enterica]|nr:hypothetical protein A9Y87_10710 [Salmonella enterica subsp. enterica]